MDKPADPIVFGTEYGPDSFPAADTPIVVDDETRHLLLSGTAGSGKSRFTGAEEALRYLQQWRASASRTRH
ncbi:hypothetical protein ADK70_12535 [Streptomyces rimosus subsp. pseudoverticillatus]|uniref:hypothetical protein n=1 Tax=Streptomyces rimosus TaxID=1927 RepID=UPI0006C39E53|nr:hypothetical protein [Streptomyces rimosus]KOT94499.1 hypothetical protein ADK70_12535 [Streptomyces rimosus subsp. pseudoverticillatus]